MITIMGATGHTGGRIAEQLLDAGEKVRALGRSKERLGALAKRGAEVVAGDAADAAALTGAFRGADAVYTLIPPNLVSPDYRAEQDRVGEAIVRALRDSGVKRVVFLSSLGAELPSGTGPIAGLGAQEKRLRSLAGVDVLVLRPGYFMENHLHTAGLIKQQGINGDSIRPDAPFPMIATRDIADVAARALAQRDWKGFTVRELLGPRDLTMAEATRILGKRIGKPDLPYVQFGETDFVAALVGMGIARNVADSYAEMGRALSDGTIKSVAGRSAASSTPTRLEDFADVFAEHYESVGAAA
jgi:uncharacterized protein YbjT (DUF2867 family)